MYMENDVLKYCENKYKWLFSKQKVRVVNKKREFYKVELEPTVVDGGSCWLIYREKDSSPLILSKNV